MKSCLTGVVALLAASAVLAQSPRRPAEVPALGQPSRWEPYVVPAVAVGDRAHAMPIGGVHRPITNPVVGLFGIAGEVYATIDPGVNPGARVLATSRVVGLSVGADWDGRSGELDALFSFRAAVRRGGFLGSGTMFRADWLPGRDDRKVAFGIEMPLGQPLAGKSRQRSTDAAPPAPRKIPLTNGAPADAEPALAKVRESALRLLEYTNLYPERNGAMNYGPSFSAVVTTYHEALAEAFRVAAMNPLIGDRMVQRARVGALDAVLLPFDSLFGQVKEQSGTIRSSTSAAHASFVAWLRDSSRVNPELQKRIASVHGHWMVVLERVHETLLDRVGDSRLVWLPLQLAIQEAEYDEQSEVDVLIERAIGRPFTDENALTYLRSTDLPLEIARSIFAARDYHVLWTHDFTGRRDVTKSIDEIAYSMVADAYLPALTQAVGRYDSTRVLPVYMIMIDQFYYEARAGRLWMDILENPLHARITLPGAANAEREAHLRKRQQELRDAVAKSWRLREDAAVNGGPRWIPDVVKVNVSVLHPHDWSFRSDRIVPPWPFVPDNIMRDHRKMVVYDVTEADPYRGATIVMGVGVGEHYASATWEDRGYRVRGLAGLEARDAARRALLANGMRESSIPFPLRATKAKPAAGRFSADGALANEPGNAADDRYVGRALQLHNEVGFAAKESSVARAMLYNLAPAGSVIIVPDPLWLSDTWAAMLAGAAARGCKVFVIAPSRASNPNPHGSIEAIERDVMIRLLGSRDRMREQMRLTGGELRVGLFTARTPVSDPEGRVREVKEGLRRYPWIRELIPFDDRTLAVLDRATQRTEGDGKDATALAQDETPRAPLLHQKTQLIARPGAIAALVRQAGWEDILASAMQTQSRQTTKFADQLGFMDPDVDSSAIRSADALLRGFESSLSEAERKAVSFYFSLGTQNQDPRGLMMDGEATLLVSGFHAATGLADLYYIMARTTWLDSRVELDRLLPRPGGIMGRLARLIRFAL